MKSLFRHLSHIFIVYFPVPIRVMIDEGSSPPLYERLCFIRRLSLFFSIIKSMYRILPRTAEAQNNPPCTAPATPLLKTSCPVTEKTYTIIIFFWVIHFLMFSQWDEMEVQLDIGCIKPIKLSTHCCWCPGLRYWENGGYWPMHGSL